MLIDLGILPADYRFEEADIMAKKADILHSEQQQATSGNVLQQALFVGFLAALDLVERCAFDASKVLDAAQRQLADWLDNEHDMVCQGFIACLKFVDSRTARSQAALMQCLRDAIAAFKQIQQHWFQQNLRKQRIN